MTARSIVVFNFIYAAIGVIGIFNLTWWVLPMWFLFAIGNGTVGHRYFAHNNFSVSPVMHWIMAIWCSLSAYSPPLYWQVQHRHHHRHSDTKEDIHSPVNGLFMSLVGWPFSATRIQSVFDDKASIINHARANRDPAIHFASEYYIWLNVFFLAVLYLIDTNLLYAAGVAVLMEHLRLGLVNSLCHVDRLFGNYRNHDTKDRSQNNFLIGWIGLGFGWHNNHHNDATKLVLTERWWEFDIEGQIGRLLAKL